MKTKSSTSNGRASRRKQTGAKPSRTTRATDVKRSAVSRLVQLGANKELAGMLERAGVVSPRRLAAVSPDLIARRLGRKLTKAEAAEFLALRHKAQILNHRIGHAAALQGLAAGPNGEWMDKIGPKIPGLAGKGRFKGCHCGCCDSIFSLKAYLFDLLDLLEHYWDITLKDVEALLLRSFDKITAFNPATLLPWKRDLSCDDLNAAVPQARIAVEVLESYGKEARQNSRLSAAAKGWQATFEHHLIRLIVPAEFWLRLDQKQPLKIRDALRLNPMPKDVEEALKQWESELRSLVLDLAGIDKAVARLSDYSDIFTGSPKGFFVDPRTLNAPEAAVSRTRDFESARDSTARTWLVAYREVLLENLKIDGDREDLENSVFLSLDAGACRTTTRLQELVTSVQQIIENIRSGEIARFRRGGFNAAHAGLPDKLRESQSQPWSEDSWQRLRDFETWLGTIYGWVYPENVLPMGAARIILPAGGELALTLPDKWDNPSARRAYLRSFPELADHGTVQFYGLVVQFFGLVDHLDGTEEDRIVAFQVSNQSWVRMVESSPSMPTRPWQHLMLALRIAHAFHMEGHFALAHDWYRCVFDPFLRHQHPLLSQPQPEIPPMGAEGILDPFIVAGNRSGAFLRYTILAMGRNVLAWADEEFARGRPDTILRAEELYEMALTLLKATALEDDACDKTIRQLAGLVNVLPPEERRACQQALAPLSSIHHPEPLSEASHAIKKALRSKAPFASKFEAIRDGVRLALIRENEIAPHRKMQEEFRDAASRADDFEQRMQARMPARFFVSPSAPVTVPVFPEPGRIGIPLDPFEPPMRPVPPPMLVLTFCIPLNPLLIQLKGHANVQLRKLKHCLDFMGHPQPQRTYGCDSADDVNQIIRRPDLPDSNPIDHEVAQPVFRYAFLMEKARQYADVAQRLGAMLLDSLRSRDNETFFALQKQNAINLGLAATELRRLGLKEARLGKQIADEQELKAQEQVRFWSSRAGDRDNVWTSLSEEEASGLALGAAAVVLHSSAALQSGFSFFTPLNSGSEATAQAASASAQASAVSLTFASFERRFEEWRNQSDLAQSDLAIAALQGGQAANRLEIAGQELAIANLQAANDQEELRFLQTKDTGASLYDWMVRVLSRDYRALMQIATGVARMAQRALEFERQDVVNFITGDYWHIAQGALADHRLTESQRNLGLLGAERLLTDLAKLDAYKLATEKRRLQITKTISLARMMPTDLVRFRQSGEITFNTLLDWFDDDFQGHYLRLVKSVRVTVLAIVPPIDGIHAMLHNTGESSVVVNEGGEFTKKRAARNFGECVALDAPFNESGLFVLNHEDPMLLPFEGLGVETQWTLELPPGSNRFNFESIADVLLTIDYTAEYSFSHREKVRGRLAAAPAHEDVALPLRLAFPDLWYHMKNQRPDAQGAFAPFHFAFTVTPGMLPQHLKSDSLTVKHLTLLASGDFKGNAAGDQANLIANLTITRGAAGAAGAPSVLHGGGAQATLLGADPDDRALLLSTRKPNAGGVVGTHHPAGAWDIVLDGSLCAGSANSQPSLLERISDILLVITVSGTRKFESGQ